MSTVILLQLTVVHYNFLLMFIANPKKTKQLSEKILEEKKEGEVDVAPLSHKS